MTWPTVSLGGIDMTFRERGGPYPVDADGIEWQCTKLDGWLEAPPPRTKRTDRPGRHGAYRSPAYTGPRIIGLEFVATATAPADPALMRRAEDRVTALLTDPDVLEEFTVTEDPLGVRSCMVERDGETKTAVRTPYSVTFSMQLAAPDPRKYGAWTNSDAVLNPGLVGGADMTDPGANLSTPGLDMGTASQGGTTTVITGGTAPVGPVVMFTGPVNQPRTYCNELGVGVQYLQTLGAGQVLYVNLGDFEVQPPAAPFPIPGRASSLDGQYQDPNVLITGGFPALPPGATTWQFTAASYDASAAMRIWTRDGYW